MTTKRTVSLKPGESVERLSLRGFDEITIRESCCGTPLFDGVQAFGSREATCPDCGARYSLTVSRA